MSGFCSKFAALAMGWSMLAAAGVGSAVAGGVVTDDGKGVTVIPESTGSISPSVGSGNLANSFALRYAPATGNGLDPIPSNNRIVIGTDSRVRVFNTTSYPYRAIAHITFSAGGCTGWFISKNTIATAGHCVHSGVKGASFYPRSSYKIYPGRNGVSTPFGFCVATQLRSNSGWVNGGGDTVDYAAIKVSCPTGVNVGHFGASNVSTLTGRSVTISGYPGQTTKIPFGTQWKMSGIISSSNSKKGFYTIDTSGGQSGAPVYENRAQGPYGLVIHAYGGNPNSGTRINSTVLSFLVNSISAP